MDYNLEELMGEGFFMNFFHYLWLKDQVIGSSN